MSEISEITDKIKKFRDERDWAPFHNHKDMALSVVLEAAELLEHFQWKTNEEIEAYVKTHREHISEEIADVAIYLLELADNLGIDIKTAVENKIDKNSEKYPVEKAKGTAKKYDQL